MPATIPNVRHLSEQAPRAAPSRGQPEQDFMYRLPVFAAALAAGVIVFAIGSANAAPSAGRNGFSQQPVVSKPAETAKKQTSKIQAEKHRAAGKRTAAVKAKKAAKGKVARRKSMRIDMTQTASIRADAKAPTAAAAPADSGRYGAIIARYAASYGVPVSLAKAVISIESNYRPHMTGSAGEVGLMQIKPATARMLGYTGSVKGLYDPETNIKFGMKYLAMARDLGGGTTCGTILKYNAGHAATRMNPVSSAYCRKVKVQMASAGSPA
jgi:soluble lytic murein transglycosylase-like protein